MGVFPAPATRVSGGGDALTAESNPRIDPVQSGVDAIRLHGRAAVHRGG